MKSAVTILVVDDEVMMRQLLIKILTREGYKVIAAEDGTAALEALKKEKVNIVIADTKLPQMNGFELLRAVKKTDPSICVIIMTAAGDTHAVKDALLLGADEYIFKPFRSFEISLIVERAYWRILSVSGTPFE